MTIPRKSSAPLDSLATAPDGVFTVWRRRERVEWEAAHLFEALGQTISRLRGKDDPVSSLSLRAASDERRHAALCQEILSHRSAHHTQHAPSGDGLLGPTNLSLDKRVLYTAVAMGCVTETLSTALLLQIQRRAKSPLIKRVVHEILEDEILHGRIGWAELAHARLKGSVNWLAPHLADMIATAIQEEAKPFSKGPDLSEWGILPRADALAIMRETVASVIEPGLRSRFA
ncbi:MAG: ferritin-like domain-containing protein [Deltaproteobacteria bacterium]|nr:ferritin-like domain-containing protein [Deltaproteobacteria bacterium]MBI3296154.1 ferritin-like domain-containing protein [Deltaproteobacteria bacterium]